MRGILKAVAIRAAVAFAAGVVVRICVIGAIGFALAAAYLRIAIETDAPTAAIATAGIAIVVALVVAAIAAAIVRRGTRPTRAYAATGTAAPAATDARLALAVEWIAENPRTAALTAFGAGLVLGVFPELRRDVLNAAATAMRPRPRRSPP